MVLIIVLRCVHVVRVDALTLIRNSWEPTLNPYNRFLPHLSVFSSLELSFLYYFHFQIFSFFYYVNLDPCLGMKNIGTSSVLPIFDSTRYFFNGENN